MGPRPLVAGNWKMNGLKSSAVELGRIVAAASGFAGVDLLVCPPATLVAGFGDAARGTPVLIGGQDCHPQPSGAYTGDIAAEMLKDAGAAAVIVGHSERRQYHGETDATVRAKALAARRAGLVAIICVGETRAQREWAKRLRSSAPSSTCRCRMTQARRTWWSRTSRSGPSAPASPRRPDDVRDMHRFIRDRLVARYGPAGQGIRILYGGSVNPANAPGLLSVENVNGALVGGASLKAADFLAIAGFYR